LLPISSSVTVPALAGVEAVEGEGSIDVCASRSSKSKLDSEPSSVTVLTLADSSDNGLGGTEVEDIGGRETSGTERLNGISTVGKLWSEVTFSLEMNSNESNMALVIVVEQKRMSIFMQKILQEITAAADCYK
jgi:2C-methyl-D-erythritol 2,4-cyclodiphosphate synthase